MFERLFKGRGLSSIGVLFCLLFFSCGNSYGSDEAQAREDRAFSAYYQGLKALAAAEDAAEAYPLFETALESSNPYIVNGAAEELAFPLLRGDLDGAAFYERLGKADSPTGTPAAFLRRPLAAAALYGLGRYGEITALYGENAPASGSIADDGAERPGLLTRVEPPLWDRIIPLLAQLRLTAEGAGAEAAGVEAATNTTSAPSLREALFEILFGDLLPMGEPLRWTAAEIRRIAPDFLGEAENALLEGRLATANSSFGAGLALFRSGLQEVGPEFFLRYPVLITDMGRCFQFTSSGNEGFELFLEWAAPGRSLPGTLARYRLLYFAGRIARARGAYERSAEIFTQALAEAPDAVQKDACIWYILDDALLDKKAEPVNLIATWAPRWHDPPYFDDILDRVARILASTGQWRRFPELLALFQAGQGYAGPISVAKYAYISGRAVAHGLISPAEAGQRNSDYFFRIAYEAGEQALYYRALSAYFLEEPFLELGDGPAEAPEEESPHPQEMDFLRGFFAQDLADLANSRIEGLADGLTVGELRSLAEALERTGAYAEQIRLVSPYMGRPDYDLARRDLELLSPRPYREMVEGRAGELGFAPELLYGLIRTESAFQPEIVSWAGAVGLTQLMPSTAEDMAGRIRRQGGPDYTDDLDAHLRQAEPNLHIGSYYLAYLQNLLDHPLLTILSYNGGMNRVRRWYAASPSLPGDLFLETIEFSETREYGRRVLSAAAVYGYLYYDMNLNTLLADICR